MTKEDPPYALAWGFSLYLPAKRPERGLTLVQEKRHKYILRKIQKRLKTAIFGLFRQLIKDLHDFSPRKRKWRYGIGFSLSA